MAALGGGVAASAGEMGRPRGVAAVSRLGLGLGPVDGGVGGGVHHRLRRVAGHGRLHRRGVADVAFRARQRLYGPAGGNGRQQRLAQLPAGAG